MQWGGPGILGFSHPDPWVGIINITPAFRNNNHMQVNLPHMDPTGKDDMTLSPEPKFFSFSC